MSTDDLDHDPLRGDEEVEESIDEWEERIERRAALLLEPTVEARYALRLRRLEREMGVDQTALMRIQDLEMQLEGLQSVIDGLKFQMSTAFEFNKLAVVMAGVAVGLMGYFAGTFVGPQPVNVTYEPFVEDVERTEGR